MFLLKQARTVLVLVTIFGMILLPDLYAQPAHADVVAKVKAALQRQIKAGAQAVADPAKAEGLTCYVCAPCMSNTDLGNKTQCADVFDRCLWGEIMVLDGPKIPLRQCAISEEVNNYSCDKFISLPENPDFADAKVRLCGCKGDLCNSQDATDTTGTGHSSFSAQLILVAASLFGSLMMK